jgi:hypothetical protein
MNLFHCDNCRNLVFFENVQCVACGYKLAFLPERGAMGSLEPAKDNLWLPLPQQANRPSYRLCQNYSKENICNWAVLADDGNPFCLSCRLTRVIPDLSRTEHREAWCKLETAKRRLIYTLRSLGLALAGKKEKTDDGLTFEFLADPETPGLPPVLTGHNDGVITVNIAEADDSVREKRRHQMHEGYRTLLGHFRHEVGHYYWDRLIRNSAWLDEYRRLFGDERTNYDEALKHHYKKGPPADWPRRFISSYASSHPWEDWAETWAHYLHMTDTLETALSCGLSLQPKPGEPAIRQGSGRGNALSIDEMIAGWFPLTYVLNNLNRGMGLPDAYPFVLSTPAIEKLRFVHNILAR